VLVVLPRRAAGVETARVDAVEDREEVTRINWIGAFAPKVIDDAPQIVAVGGDLGAGAPPFARAPITIGLLRPWPDVGAPGHLVVGAWLLLCDQFGKQRECFTFKTLATR